MLLPSYVTLNYFLLLKILNKNSIADGSVKKWYSNLANMSSIVRYLKFFKILD